MGPHAYVLESKPHFIYSLIQCYTRRKGAQPSTCCSGPLAVFMMGAWYKMCMGRVGQHGSAWVSMGQHGPAWVSMGQHGSAWVSMGQHGSAWVSMGRTGYE